MVFREARINNGAAWQAINYQLETETIRNCQLKVERRFRWEEGEIKCKCSCSEKHVADR